MFTLAFMALTLAQPAPLGAGDHTRTLMMGKDKRTYLVHVPKGYDPKKPTPVIVALHGAGMNGAMMPEMSGLSKTSDQAGFIVVYPSALGFWNAGGFGGKTAKSGTDDVAFIGKMLDELATAVNVDQKRVYACGLSMGGMMSYRLAAELSDRIVAIAPVAGTMTVAANEPKRPVPVIAFHGTKDALVPFESKGAKSSFMRKGAEGSVEAWAKLNGCEEKPKIDVLSKDGDELKVVRKTYGGGKDGAEVVLIVVEGGGHSWPGIAPPPGIGAAIMGKSAMNISANDLMWEFFKKYQLK